MTNEGAMSSVDVAEVVGKAQIGRLQWTVVLLSALTIMLDGYDSLAVTFAAPTLSREMGRSIASFGPIFSASTFGLILGSLALGPVADRAGRKNILLGAVFVFAVGSLWPVFDFAYGHLLAFRILTGIGLGAAMPAAIALTAEYVPDRQRTLLVNLMFIGYPLGGVVGGIIASRLVPSFGWRAVFYLGGIGPLVLIPLIALFMPESIAFLTTRGADARERIGTILRRLDSSRVFGSAPVYTLARERIGERGLQTLFSDGEGIGTVLLWLIFFFTLFVVSVMAYWLPAMMDHLGLPIERAIIVPAIFLAGGVIGALIQGIAIDRNGATRTLVAAYVAAGILLFLLGRLEGRVPLALAVVFAIGVCGVGAQLSINALAAHFYATRNRSTGIGWALGIGRSGSIVGPLVGALMFRPSVGLERMLLLVAAASLLAALSVYAFGRRYPSRASRSAPA